MTVNGCVAESGFGVAESVAVIDAVNVPCVVGVPETTPSLAFSVNPGGSEPDETDHVYGPTPPAATTE